MTITKKEASAAGAGLFFRAGDSPRGLAEQIELADMPVYIHHAVRYVDINGHMEFYCAIYLHFFGLRIIIMV